ncbi:MAG: hypothetical protein AB9907_06390 [Flexilinea sp.]
MKTSQYAYRLAPWRKQIQNIINVLMVLILVACVTMVYLFYSAQMTKMKLQIQTLHAERSDLSRTIADYITKEGKITAFAEMEKRALQAGYIDIDILDEEVYSYVLVPGFSKDFYSGLEVVNQRVAAPVSAVKPEYTESLQQWLNGEISIQRSDQ